MTRSTSEYGGKARLGTELENYAKNCRGKKTAGVGKESAGATAFIERL